MWRDAANPATEAAVSQEKLFGDQPFQILSRGVQGCQVVRNSTLFSLSPMPEAGDRQ